ncbi:alcohol dehydrogenase-like regulatory protein ErcA [Maridesulfovibrio ferrireducens]|uniref:alcohol dehydrogenase-like regulatory protein ErcA n=1 Tax=Maridesulfovibrio ferrireducens TaxID=246191 RepID=UPI001A19F289|nr:alcohol dehydrogenase-like regulatory protein ErcA [Maridesulfovibrio ferrireducens]MBI9110567.1 iron-containing alcohol dehydrogenase [Maridesulfovibrio ferrireducens]
MKEVMAMRKFVAPELVFGAGSALLAGQYAENFGARRALMVTDPGVLHCRWIADVKDSLNRAGIETFVFSDVSENPRDVEVMKGAEFYKENNCDCIVAVGGGSPMDCAKAIGIVTTNNAHILSFEGVDMVDSPGPPLICIPSTAGSSADVSQFAIITDTVRHVKISIVSKAMVPDAALVDPSLTTTMGSQLTAATGLDALTHAIEAYVSNANSALTDLFALDAIKLVSKNLVSAIKNPDNIELRGFVMLGSMEAGLAFSNAILGAVHAMAHSLGGHLNLPHGECNAILLPYVIKTNFSSAEDRYTDIAKAMSVDVEGKTADQICGSLIDVIVALRKDAGITKTLKDFGLKREDIPKLAELALKDACMVTNPVELNSEDVEKIYEAAF